jgi:hypothetical protein
LCEHTAGSETNFKTSNAKQKHTLKENVILLLNEFYYQIALKKLVVYILSFIVLISCNEDDNENCLDYETAYVTSANSSPRGVINQNITIEVLFRVINGCGSFNNFIEIYNGNTILS